MSENINSMLQYIPDFVFFIVGDVPFLALLLGAVFILIGLFILMVYVMPRIVGYRVTGTVLGGLREVRKKEKTRDGKVKTEEKISYTPIYEYQRRDGTCVKAKASHGGDITFSYKTGQSVELLIWDHRDFDDVYDAKSKSALIIGPIFLLIGAAIITAAGNFLASLKVGALSISVMLILLILKIISGLRNKKPQSNKKPNKSTFKGYIFNMDDVLPVEQLKLLYDQERQSANAEAKDTP